MFVIRMRESYTCTILVFIWLCNNCSFEMYTPYFYDLSGSLFSNGFGVMCMKHYSFIGFCFFYFYNIRKDKKEIVVTLLLPVHQLRLKHSKEVVGWELNPDFHSPIAASFSKGGACTCTRRWPVQGKFLAISFCILILVFINTLKQAVPRRKAFSYYISNGIFRDVKF